MNNTIENDKLLVESTEKLINEKILAITLSIQNNYPELSKYLDEMPITLPDETSPEINLRNLDNYYLSLVSLVHNYQTEHINLIPDYKTDERISLSVRDFLKRVNSTPANTDNTSIDDMKLSFIKMQASVIVDNSGVEAYQKTIRGDGHIVTLNIVRPENNTEKLPVFAYIHGGGWVLGNFNSYLRIVRDIVLESNMCCVFINYSLSPEVQYPVAIEEITMALKWLHQNGSELNIDSSKIGLVGNSAGANLAIAAALKAKDENRTELASLCLMWPIVDNEFETTSYNSYAEDRFLTKKLVKWMYDLYIPDLSKRNEIYASPLNASVDQLKGLPPTIIMVAENDILRDEAEAFGKKLDEAHVDTATIRYNGMIHDFAVLNDLANIPQTRLLINQIAEELKKQLISN